MTFALTLAFAATSNAQNNSWTNRYNGPGSGYDYARALALDGDGNVFVTGYSAGNGGYVDYATIAYSRGGESLWTNRYNGLGNNDDAASAIAVDGDGNVFVTGDSTSSGAGLDYVTIKYSGDGVSVWTNSYNGSENSDDLASAIAVDSNGDVVVTGHSMGSGGLYDYATIKYANNGIPLWTNRYNGPGNGSDYPVALAMDGNGNVFVTGASRAVVGYYDYATIKYSSAGVPLWTNRFNGSGNDEDRATAVAVDGSGNVFVAGYSWENSGGIVFVVIKYSNDGVPLWTNRCDDGFGNSGNSAIALDGNGNVFLTGGYLTVKYSNNGVLLWTNNVRGNFIAVDGNGNVFTTAGEVTRKYSNDGFPLWTNRSDGHFASGIAVDSSGNVFVAGDSTGSGTGVDYVTIKYAAPPQEENAVLENPKVTANEFSFHLVAEPGGQFAIQVSTNLVDWEAVRQVTMPASGSTNIVEFFTPQTGQKYFRAQRQ